MTFKYMKAPSESVKLEDVRVPIWASYKLDGYRASHHGDTVLSKSLQVFRNAHVQRLYANPALANLDGELIVGEPYGEDVIRRTNSGLTRAEGTPDVTWWVFDDFTNPTLPFHIRHSAAKARVKALGLPHVKLLTHKALKTIQELVDLEQHAIDKGYEGLMLRDPDGPYKFGDATHREGWMFKFKRFTDAEAVVYAVEEGNVNGNEKKEDGTRRTLKAGMTPSGMVGTLLCKDLETGAKIRVAPGKLTHAERQLPCTFLGQIITYRVFPTGTINAPRFPRFHAFRPRSDIA